VERAWNVEVLHDDARLAHPLGISTALVSKGVEARGEDDRRRQAR
jgi:hypothetical protein